MVYHEDHQWSRTHSFAAQFMKDLNKLVGIESNLSTIYHPPDRQTNGTYWIKRLKKYAMTIHYSPTVWLGRVVIMRQSSYNDKVPIIHRFLPVLYQLRERHPYKGTNPRWAAKSPSANQVHTNISRKFGEEAEAALKQSAEETMKRNYDRKKGDSREYLPGERVWLEGTNITTDQRSKTRRQVTWPPSSLTKKVGEIIIPPQTPRHWKKVHATFNENTSPLSSLQNSHLRNSQTPPPPNHHQRQQEYIVEEHYGFDTLSRKAQVSRQVGGYPSRMDWTWDPESSILPDNEPSSTRSTPGATMTSWHARNDISTDAWTPYNDAPEEITWPNGKLTDDIDRGRSTLQGGNVTNEPDMWWSTGLVNFYIYFPFPLSLTWEIGMDL